MHDRRTFLAGAGAGIVVPLCSHAQHPFPSRPIRLVLPFPPGGVYDTVARPLVEKLKAHLGTIVIENQGGAGGALAFSSVAKAPPDGYTLLLGGFAGFVINAIAASRPTYDMRQFDPVTTVASTGYAIAVHPSAPFTSLEGLVKNSESAAGLLSYATAGVGSMNHLTGELFKSLAARPNIEHVPYRGSGPAMMDLVSGQIPMGVLAVTGQVLELHKSGKLRILAITTPRRIAAAPDIATAVEAGFPGLVARTVLALFAPAGTPADIIELIAGAVGNVMRDAEFQARLNDDGIQPWLDSSPDLTRRALADEFALWSPIIRSIGLKLD